MPGLKSKFFLATIHRLCKFNFLMLVLVETPQECLFGLMLHLFPMGYIFTLNDHGEHSETAQFTYSIRA